MTNGNWHWQELGSAWKGVGIYHVTLIIPSREQLLGKLIIPKNDPKQAYIQRTNLGNALVEKLLNHPAYYPEVQILQYCLMPDHLHAILYVKRPMKQTFNMVVRSFWQAAKKLGRAYTSSNKPEFDSGLTNGENTDAPFPVFTERPFVRPMSRRGQLKTMIHYVQLNPQRLATKRLMPDYFCVQESVEIAGRMYRGVGNTDLLQRAQYMPVHVRSVWVRKAEQHGDDQLLRDYMNSCVLAARKGTVMVSPFISPQEKMVQKVLLEEGLPFILLADNLKSI